MHTNQSLYFPDTDIDTDRVCQELFFFDHIFFYEAAEKSGAAERGDELCSGYPPLPFGSELDRFNRLIKELKGHEAEFYSGQLSGMALFNQESRDEKTIREIITSVSGENKETGRPESKDGLWQCRLLLKLAEIKRKEEEELEKELNRISAKEASLYDSLKGDPEIDKLMADSARIKSGGLTEMTDTILRAWGILFLNDDRRDRHNVLMTANKDAAESIFEAHNALNGRLPVRLCRLSLPIVKGMDKEALLDFRDNFREKAKKVLAGFSELFSKVIQEGREEDTLQKSTMLAAEWGSLIEETAPAASLSASRGREPKPCHLEIYLSEYSLAALVARHCRLSPLSDYTGKNYGLIALKTSRPITCTD